MTLGSLGLAALSLAAIVWSAWQHRDDIGEDYFER